MTRLRRGLAHDFSYIDTLRKKEGQALGFVPRETYLSILERRLCASGARYLYSDIFVTEDNGDLTGFCYVSYHGQMASVFQIAVQQDARRWHRALLMIDEVERNAKEYGKVGITCRVAYDLESNAFWKALGYQPIKLVTSTWLNQRESKSKRPLWQYYKSLPGLFDTPQLFSIATI